MGPLRYNTHKTSSTWVKGSNERLETVKCQEQKKRKKLHTTAPGDDFLDLMPKAQTTRAKMDKWGASN